MDENPFQCKIQQLLETHLEAESVNINDILLIVLIFLNYYFLEILLKMIYFRIL